MHEESVSIRELNQHTSDVVRRVAADHRPRAILSRSAPTGVVLCPAHPRSGVLESLVATGRAVPPGVPAAPVAPPHSGEGVDVAAALAADRDADERW